MKHKTRLRLLDALDSCHTILRYADGIDFETYLRQGEKRDAVERRLAIIGEALRRAETFEPELATQLPELREIVGMRNHLIHGYGDVNNAIVWDVVQNKIPTLQARLAEMLAEPETR